jgi:carbamoyltransferase
LRDLLPGIRISFLNHHLAHAASAFFNSGFNQATVLIIDGQGESDTVSVYLGDDQGLHELSKTRWPHSLGIFYLFATQYLGFRLGDEYKVMGMSAYGKPVYFPILRPMITVTESAEVLLRETEHLSLENMAGSGYFAFLFTDKMRQVVPRRSKEGRILQEHLDFAASVQKLTEEVGVELALQAVKLTGVDNLAIAGGVGLNGLMNNRIRTSGVCRDFFVYPASSDDGTSVGAAQVAAFCRNKYPPGGYYPATTGMKLPMTRPLEPWMKCASNMKRRIRSTKRSRRRWPRTESWLAASAELNTARARWGTGLYLPGRGTGK